jgi:carboxymethylenebutenolidase
MTATKIGITTPHGTCETQLFTPDGPGPWPAVIVCFDAFGARPAIDEIATRLARSGYVAVVPDLYYRVGSPFVLKPEVKDHDAKALFGIFGDAKLAGEFMGRWLGPTLAYDHLRDTVGPVLDALEKHPSVKGGVGTTGYCMGGNASLRLATIFGDRIRATASFHGGGLATPQDDSPHKRLASVKSRVYVAAAVEDAHFNDEAKALLTAALEAAHVKHTVETYPGHHGFAVRDNPSYDEACAERHYAAMASLFGETLKA